MPDLCLPVPNRLTSFVYDPFTWPNPRVETHLHRRSSACSERTPSQLSWFRIARQAWLREPDCFEIVIILFVPMAKEKSRGKRVQIITGTQVEKKVDKGSEGFLVEPQNRTLGLEAQLPPTFHTLTLGCELTRVERLRVGRELLSWRRP